MAPIHISKKKVGRYGREVEIYAVRILLVDVVYAEAEEEGESNMAEI